jgi:class 3 adenylate cyclase
VPANPDKTVLFADLRGSTGLFETLGNRAATEKVSRSIAAMARDITRDGGTVVKTLGDGLMALFAEPEAAVRAAFLLHEATESQRAAQDPSQATRAALQLRVSITRGEVVELPHDWFGDAINVAARMLDHATDQETLISAAAWIALSPERKMLFRRLGPIALRGRAEPVELLVCSSLRATEAATTQSESMTQPLDPPRLRLLDEGRDHLYERNDLPLLIGRDPSCQWSIDHPKASRTHARIEWHAGAFVISDLSFNGTHVRFADGDSLHLRRTSCMLHGRGSIGLAGPPDDAGGPGTLRFEVHYPNETAFDPL